MLEDGKYVVQSNCIYKLVEEFGGKDHDAVRAKEIEDRMAIINKSIEDNKVILQKSAIFFAKLDDIIVQSGSIYGDVTASYDDEPFYEGVPCQYPYDDIRDIFRDVDFSLAWYFSWSIPIEPKTSRHLLVTLNRISEISKKMDVNGNIVIQGENNSDKAESILYKLDAPRLFDKYEFLNSGGLIKLCVNFRFFND